MPTRALLRATETQDVFVDLDPIESRNDKFEIVQRMCIGGFLGAVLWALLHMPSIASEIIADSDDFLSFHAKMFPIAMLAWVSLFALSFFLLNARRPIAIALGGLPIIVFGISALAASSRPLVYRLADWSTNFNVLLNCLLVFGLVFFIAWLFVFAGGWLDAAALYRDKWAEIYRGNHLRTAKNRMLDLAFGIPPVVSRMPNLRTRTRLLFLCHALLCALIAYLPFAVSCAVIGFPLFEQMMHFPTEEAKAAGFGPQVAYAYFWSMVFTTSALILTLPVLAWLSRQTLALARSCTRVGMHELLGSDRRRPILFLRSFRDDQVKLRAEPRLIKRWLAGLTTGRMLLDHLLIEELSTLGPVVGLGSPGDPVPPYGAARGYFDMGKWQEGVRYLLDQSGLVLIVLDDTPGSWWEIEQVVSRPDLLAKTIFFAHPENAASGKSAELFDKLASRLGKSSGFKRLESIAPNTSRVLGVRISPEGNLWLESTSFSAAAFSLALRRYSAELLDDRQQIERKTSQTSEACTSIQFKEPTSYERQKSLLLAGSVASFFAAASAIVVAGLSLIETPDRFMGVAIRPWLASTITLLPLLLFFGVRQLGDLILLLSSWALSWWLSGSIFHSVLQTNFYGDPNVAWGIFYHADCAAHAIHMFLLGGVLTWMFSLNVLRWLWTAILCALVAATLRWGLDTLSMELLPINELSNPALGYAQYFLLVAPSFVFLAILLFERNRIRGEEMSF